MTSERISAFKSSGAASPADRTPSSRRVLHVLGAMNRGGAETMIMNVYRAIDRRAVQFDFAVGTASEGHYDAEIRALGGRIFPHPDPTIAGLRTYRRAFRATLETSGPFRAVHSHQYTFSGVILQTAYRCGVTTRMAHSHGVSDGKPAGLGRVLYRSAMRWMLSRYATDLLGCSPEACEALYGPDCWHDRRVRVLPNPVSLARFCEVTSDAGALRRQLRLPESGHLIGHIGNFNPVKNHEFIIAVFRALRRRLPETQLVLVGDGPLRAHVEDFVRANGLSGIVHFLGSRSDTPEILGALDAFVFPSLSESFGLVLVEAQAAGLPCVVSSAVPRTADVSLGVLRYLPLQAGVDAWADALRDALDMPRPTREDCHRAIRTAGYDAADVGKRLCSAYV